METTKQTTRWRPPASGFEVSLSISSTVLNPDEVTAAVGMQPSRIRYALGGNRKYHTWWVTADRKLPTIQDHIDEVLNRVQEFAKAFKELHDCDASLNVYLYLEQYLTANPDTHPSFCLSDNQVNLLQSMNASFVVD